MNIATPVMKVIVIYQLVKVFPAHGAHQGDFCPSSICAQQESATPCMSNQRWSRSHAGGGGREMAMAIRGPAEMVTKRSRTERYEPTRANTDRERILRKTAVYRTIQDSLIRPNTARLEFRDRPVRPLRHPSTIGIAGFFGP